jgi:hypothetical protein
MFLERYTKTENISCVQERNQVEDKGRKEILLGGVAQVVEYLLCKHEPLSSNPNPATKIKKKIDDFGYFL